MNTKTKPAHWENDLHQRKIYANFLRKIIDKRSLNPANTNATSMTIDGDWGTGKTFFIENWSNSLIEDGRCVIFFDAWKNDLSDEPLIGFMSEVNKCLKPWMDQIAVNESIPDEIKDRTKTLLKNAAGAIIPLGKQVLKDAASKYISKEVTDIFSGINSDESNTDEKSKAFEIKSEDIEKYFEAALKSHEMQNVSIGKLIEDLEALTEGLPLINVTPPIYIFIDELDRCRPTYAIKLLESIKHIFNAKGICFVLATNLDQLAHSIKAVYGESFNARSYLKRFIDYEYRLNPPDNYTFCHHLVSASTLVGNSNLYSGIIAAPIQNEVADVLADVANLFNLDLRSIKQIFGQSEAAIASIEDDEIIHCLYMFAIAAIMHKNPESIDIICTTVSPLIPKIDELATGINRKFPEWGNDRTFGHRKELNISLKELINIYQRLSVSSNPNALDRSDYEESAYKTDIFRKTQISLNNRGVPKFAKYPALLRTAGLITSN